MAEEERHRLLFIPLTSLISISQVERPTRTTRHCFWNVCGEIDVYYTMDGSW